MRPRDPLQSNLVFAPKPLGGLGFSLRFSNRVGRNTGCGAGAIAFITSASRGPRGCKTGGLGGVPPGGSRYGVRRGRGMEAFSLAFQGSAGVRRGAGSAGLHRAAHDRPLKYATVWNKTLASLLARFALWIVFWVPGLTLFLVLIFSCASL